MLSSHLSTALSMLALSKTPTASRYTGAAMAVREGLARCTLPPFLQTCSASSSLAHHGEIRHAAHAGGDRRWIMGETAHALADAARAGPGVEIALSMRFSWVVMLPGSRRVLSQFLFVAF